MGLYLRLLFLMQYKCILIYLILFSSCLKENKIIVKQGFENPNDRWNNVNIIKGDSHGGKFISRTDAIQPFSACFTKNIRTISEREINRIDIVSWVKRSAPLATGYFVLSIDRGRDQLYWQGVPTPTGDFFENQWKRMYASYDIPDSLRKDVNIRVYFWNTSKYNIDADDFEIRLYY